MVRFRGFMGFGFFAGGDRWFRVRPQPAMQFGVGTLGSAQPHARGDPFERQGGFPAQPRGQPQFARVVFAPVGQVALPGPIRGRL